MCNCGTHRHFGPVRLLFGLILLGLVFIFGLMVGRFHGGYGEGGYQHFRGYPMMRGNVQYGSGMMPFYNSNSITPSAPATPPQAPAPTTTK